MTRPSTVPRAFAAPDGRPGTLARAALVALGLVELAAPERLVDVWLRLAVADDDVEVEPWVYTAARIEGLLILVRALTRGSDGDGDDGGES